MRHIAVICLFRKFSFQKKGDRIYTVYGPQIIGRGLRRIRPPNERDHLFTVDHPAFNHGWLWQLLAAQEYAKPLNPGDAVDEQTMEELPFEPPLPTEPEEGEDKEDKPELDIEDIIADLPTVLSTRVVIVHNPGMNRHSKYRGYRFPPEIISRADYPNTPHKTRRALARVGISRNYGKAILSLKWDFIAQLRPALCSYSSTRRIPGPFLMRFPYANRSWSASCST